mgnify:FL=1
MVLLVGDNSATAVFPNPLTKESQPEPRVVIFSLTLTKIWPTVTASHVALTTVRAVCTRPTITILSIKYHSESINTHQCDYYDLRVKLVIPAIMSVRQRLLFKRARESRAPQRGRSSRPASTNLSGDNSRKEYGSQSSIEVWCCRMEEYQLVRQRHRVTDALTKKRCEACCLYRRDSCILSWRVM